MRIAAAGLGLLWILMAPCALADKISTDPNAPGAAKPAAPTAKPDPRLQKKITCEIGYVRLHTVIDKLAADSEVKIYSGKSPKDWQVRDLPVTVYVKDVPLGDLLDALAQATHLTVAPSKVKDEITYRIYRTGAQQAYFDSYIEARAELERQKSRWAWDALVQMKDVTDAEIAQHEASLPEWRKKDLQSQRRMGYKDQPAFWRAMAKVLEQVPDEQRDKALSGKKLIFSTAAKPAALGNAIRELAIVVWKRDRDREDDTSLPSQPPANLLDKMDLQLFTMDGLEMNLGNICLKDSLMEYDEATHTMSGSAPESWSRKLDDAARSMAETSGRKLPDPPKDTLDEKDDTDTFIDGEWNLPFLRTKADLDRPKDVVDPTFADLLRKLHDRGGINIVSQDFVTHMVPMLFDASEYFGKQQKPGRVLLNASRDVMWHADEDNRMVVGRARMWQNRQMNLVKESDYVNFCRKLGTDEGVGLDDYLFTLWLTNGQFTDWIAYSREASVPVDSVSVHEGRPFWYLYDQLSPEQKQLAKSEAGFALSQCDPAWVSTALEEYRDAVSDWNAVLEIHEPGDEREIDLKAMPLPSDRIGISTMKLYLCSADFRGSFAWAGGAQVPLVGKQYHLRLTWKNKGQVTEVNLPTFGTTFPVHGAKKKPASVPPATQPK